MSLSTLVTYFQGIFSRKFWFGTFLPLATFAAINIALAVLLLGLNIERSEWGVFGEGAVSNGTLAIAALIVLSYAISPLIPVLRGLFTGSLLPGWLYDLLRGDRQAEAWQIKKQQADALKKSEDYRQYLGDFSKRLREAPDAAKLAAAAALGKAEEEANSENVTEVAGTIDKLSAALDRGRTPSLSALKLAADKILEIASSHPRPTLKGNHLRMRDALSFATALARNEYVTMVNRNFGINVENPQATRVGDARFIVEGYARQMYNVDFTFIWPRLWLVIPDDSSLVSQVQMAEGQVDFSALSLVLSILTALAWPVLLVVHQAALWQLLVFGLAAPAAIAMFYRLLFESQLALGEVIKLSLDSRRLDLLTKVLRQPLPATLFTERKLWGNLQLAQSPGTGIDLVYRHPPAGAPQ